MDETAERTAARGFIPVDQRKIIALKVERHANPDRAGTENRHFFAGRHASESLERSIDLPMPL